MKLERAKKLDFLLDKIKKSEKEADALTPIRKFREALFHYMEKGSDNQEEITKLIDDTFDKMKEDEIKEQYDLIDTISNKIKINNTLSTHQIKENLQKNTEPSFNFKEQERKKRIKELQINIDQVRLLKTKAEKLNQIDRLQDINKLLYEIDENTTSLLTEFKYAYRVNHIYEIIYDQENRFPKSKEKQKLQEFVLLMDEAKKMLKRRDREIRIHKIQEVPIQVKEIKRKTKQRYSSKKRYSSHIKETSDELKEVITMDRGATQVTIFSENELGEKEFNNELDEAMGELKEITQLIGEATHVESIEEAQFRIFEIQTQMEIFMFKVEKFEISEGYMNKIKKVMEELTDLNRIVKL